VSILPNGKSGDLGTAATCHDIDGSSGSIVCGNFQTPRTFTVNGTTTFNCAAGGTFTLPAPRNGGWCFEASAGNFSYAYFESFNVR
jgi:hypothetical protein